MYHMWLFFIAYSIIIHYIQVSVFHFTSIYTYSLEWDEVQWRDIGDDGAIALADPRVFKNFTTLK